MQTGPRVWTSAPKRCRLRAPPPFRPCTLDMRVIITLGQNRYVFWRIFITTIGIWAHAHALAYITYTYMHVCIHSYHRCPARPPFRPCTLVTRALTQAHKRRHTYTHTYEYSHTNTHTPTLTTQTHIHIPKPTLSHAQRTYAQKQAHIQKLTRCLRRWRVCERATSRKWESTAAAARSRNHLNLCNLILYILWVQNRFLFI